MCTSRTNKEMKWEDLKTIKIRSLNLVMNRLIVSKNVPVLRKVGLIVSNIIQDVGR